MGFTPHDNPRRSPPPAVALPGFDKARAHEAPAKNGRLGRTFGEPSPREERLAGRTGSGRYH